MLCWAERKEIIILPQFVPGRDNVVANALSCPSQVIGWGWTLHQEVFDWLQKRWLVTVDLFASSLNYHCGGYFAPVSDPMAAGTDAMLQSWDSLQDCAFLPIALIPQVLVKLRLSAVAVLKLIVPIWPQSEWFPDILDLLLEPPFPLPDRWDLLRQLHVRRFHQNFHVLWLHAWRLSSDSSEPPDSPRRWLVDLAAHVDRLR